MARLYTHLLPSSSWGDIRPLALHFLNKTNQQNQRNVHLTAQALDALEKHAWPGHIRELANVIERTVLLTDQPIVSRKELEGCPTP